MSIFRSDGDQHDPFPVLNDTDSVAESLNMTTFAQPYGPACCGTCTHRKFSNTAGMIFLSIETSTHVCSVAAVDGDRCLAQELDARGQNHARLLSRFIDRVLDAVSRDGRQIDAVALSQGPGSYTGLRIGTATAKGLCYGLDLPLVPVDTLQAIAMSALRTYAPHDDDLLVCPMIDARRMEVYTAFYDTHLNRQGDVEAVVVNDDSFHNVLDTHRVLFCGNGAAKCADMLHHPNAVFVADIMPEAQYVGMLAARQYDPAAPTDIAYFDPFYLKEFQAVRSRNKLW